MSGGRLPNGLISFGPKANCTLDLCPIQSTVFQYRPSLAANSVFIALFALSIVTHIVLGIRWRSWFFMGAMILGGISEIIGYGGRLIMYNNPFSFTGFMIQICCITFAPVFYTAAIYVTIGKTVQHLDVSLSRLPPRLYYWIFIICDVS
jgi:hypothetical protein